MATVPSELLFGNMSKHFFEFFHIKCNTFAPKLPIIIGHNFFLFLQIGNLKCEMLKSAAQK